MLVWLVINMFLLLWNAIYRGLRVAADFRGPKPADGVWGVFALIGALSTIVLTLVGLGVTVSGI